MQFLTTVFAFILALGLLVTVHELGHFCMARYVGVRVLRFSIGFGPPLFRWTDRRGTEFWLSGIPLGGYVKMLDRREGPIPDELLTQEFTQKTVKQRMAVFAAGPLVNLLFATLIYWGVMMNGITQIAPIIGEIKPTSPLASQGIQSGWELAQVDGQLTSDWEAVTFALVKHMGEAGQLILDFKAPGTAHLEQRRVALSENWMDNTAQEQDPLQSLGLIPWQPFIAPVIARVLDHSVAQKSGLQAKDRIISLAGHSIVSWLDCLTIIQQSAGQPLRVVLQRGQQIITMMVTPEIMIEKGKKIGRLGVLPEMPVIPDEYVRHIHYGVWQAAAAAVQKTLSFSAITLVTIGKMLVGQVSFDNLSGPITIAKIAGDRASYGVEPFLSFLAYLSISLGILNLLPIPVLDGGHLLYASIEWLRGKPLSDRLQQWGLNIGVSLIVMLMLMAFYNDLVRVLS